MKIGRGSTAARAGAALALCCALLLAASPARAEGPAACPATAPVKGADKEAVYQGLQRAAEGSPFFKAALRKGKVTGCAASGDEDNVRVVYTFGKDKKVTLEAHASPGAGFSEQVLVLEQTPAGARQLAGLQEKALWQPGGCGIVWTGAGEQEDGASAGTQVEVRRAPEGTNCSARITRKGSKVIELRLLRAD